MNGHPGPRRVLDAGAAGQLDLRAEQRAAVQRVFDTMHEQAMAKGREVREAEANLAMRFHHTHIDETSLREVLDRIARLRADRRFIHLRAPLETTALLTPDQIARYKTLHGYDAGAGSHQH